MARADLKISVFSVYGVDLTEWQVKAIKQILAGERVTVYPPRRLRIVPAKVLHTIRRAGASFDSIGALPDDTPPDMPPPAPAPRIAR